MSDVLDITTIIGADKLQDAQLSNMANGRAAATALPGPVKEAFIAGPIKVGKYMVRQFVAADWIIMQTLDSPLQRLWLELQKPAGKQDPIEYSDEEECLICWQFTRPAKEAYQAARTWSRAQILEIASNEFMFEGGVESPLIIQAASEQFKRHILTRLEYAAEVQKEGKVSFFPQTALDGSQITSVAS